jgi:hypothetical protein
MEAGSTKHGPHVDDELKRETLGLVQGGRATHAEEWRDPEPPGEDQPGDPVLVGGTPPGLRPEEVEARSELARYLIPSLFPAVGQVLMEAAAGNQAPQSVLDRLRGLPTGKEYANVADVWRSLGGGAEVRV